MSPQSVVNIHCSLLDTLKQKELAKGGIALISCTTLHPNLTAFGTVLHRKVAEPPSGFEPRITRPEAERSTS